MDNEKTCHGGIPAPELLQSGFIQGSEGGKRFGCRICNKKFILLRTYERHVSDKHRVKTYHCKVCNKAFNNRQVLKEHCEQNHQEERVPCKLCNKTFTTRSSLRLHHDAIHKGIRYKCKHCKKSFGQLGSLRRHVNTIHEDLPGAKFSIEQALTREASEDVEKIKIDNTEELKDVLMEKKFKETLVLNRSVNDKQILNNALVTPIVSPNSSTTLAMNTISSKNQENESTYLTPSPLSRKRSADFTRIGSKSTKISKKSKNSENVMYVSNKRASFDATNIVPKFELSKPKKAKVDFDVNTIKNSSFSIFDDPKEFTAVAILISMKA